MKALSTFLLFATVALLFPAVSFSQQSNSSATETEQQGNIDKSHSTPHLLDVAKVKSHSNHANNRTAAANSHDTIPHLLDAAKIKSHSNQANNRTAAANSDDSTMQERKKHLANIKWSSRSTNPKVNMNNTPINVIQSNMQIDDTAIEGIIQVSIDADNKQVDLTKSPLATDKQWLNFKKIVFGDVTDKRVITIFFKTDDGTTNSINLSGVFAKYPESVKNSDESILLNFETMEYKIKNDGHKIRK